MRRMRTTRIAAAAAVALTAALLTACGGSDQSTSTSSGGSTAAATSAATTAAASTTASSTDGGGDALAQTLDYITNGAKPSKQLHIAWLKADAKNPYTLAEQTGGLDAAKKFGADVKVFDGNFNPSTQSQQLQDALTGYDSGKYDALVVEPVAGQVVCPRLRQAIAKGVIVAVDNQPLCGDDGYTEGAAGYAGIQLQRYFDQHAENAFKSCEGKPCKALVITGPVGFDVATKLQTSLKTLASKYPNVKVVGNQASDFSAQSGFKITRDALTANPDLNLVISQWDDQMTGVVQAIEQAGKKAGTDVRIYSNGADKTGVDLLKQGKITETTALLPYEEGYYAMAQAIRAAAEGKKTVGTAWLGDGPAIKDGPGTIFITKDNVDQWKPQY
jgi:ABC-type sugar transport system substrate-binding protein